jgi:hypothetical protein
MHVKISMTIRQIKPEPTLPPAHLYLEDIEEIIQVLTESEKSRRQHLGDEREPTVKFLVGNRECDDIEDLKKIGGTWTKFKVQVGLSTFMVMLVGSSVLGRDVFDDIRRIVSARESKVKSTLQELPWWGLAIISFLGILAIQHLAPKHASSLVYYVPIAVIVCTSYAMFRHTVVELRYSHDKEPRSKTVKEWLSRAIWIILGVILAGAGQLLWSYLAKRLGH